ncbi:MAG TPA: LLM class F420-dependent oxidoreductase [Acidimicrobiales bacterium]|nr:LLM class F420-dependent oxidoreductase [Acidimicrobiales bacterium]
MDLRVFTEPQQGASYETLLAVARATAEAGFSGFFRSDHLLKMGDTDGLPGPTEAWLTLAALGRETTGIALGTLVTSATFRYPGMLAIAVAQADQMSGGRVELGLGTGWYEAEHTAYGIPFPPLAERFEMLEEQLAIITGMWDTPVGGTFEFSGRHYRIRESPALPKPVRRPPVIVGGSGRVKTPRLAARYADEYNQAFPRVEDIPAGIERINQACRDIDRDPDEITRSAALVMCCGSDEAEVTHRASRIGREVDELRTNGICGTPDEVVARIEDLGSKGLQRLYLQILDLADLDHLALIGSEVIPEVAN